MKVNLTISTFFITLVAYFPLQAQLANDSTLLIQPDSTVAARLNQLDSIRHETESDYLKFKNKYDSVNQSASAKQAKLQSKIDSLTTLNLPTLDLSRKLYSATEARTSKLKELESKWEKTKSKHTSSITELNLLPPWDQGQQSLVAATSKLDIKLPVPEANLPSLSMDQGLNVDLPGVESPLGDLDVNTPNLSNMKPEELNQVEGYSNDIKAVKEGEVDEVIDNQLQNVDGVGELKAQQNQMEMPSLDQAKAKQRYLQMAKQSAMQHFAGKFDQVDNAMNNMSKLKKKYSSVQSIKNLPKRKPNEMRDKPFVERLVPAFNLQLMQRNVWMLDFNPSLGYRFNSHFSTGIGWVQRWGYNFDSNEYAYEERMYGPRVYGEYELKQGFTFKLESDYVNALVRTLFDDPIGRDWVWNLKAGIKKEYRINKKINGNIQALYNVIDPDKRSPYPRFNIRIGFDFGLKKRVKEEVTQ